MSRFFNISVRKAWRPAGLFMLLLASGCGTSPVNPPGDAGSARTTLEQVLDLWKSGMSPDDLKSMDPALYVADPDWSAGRGLAKYEIVAEPTQNGGEWRVLASLTLAGNGTAKSPRKVYYSVSPGAPANVCRSDYVY
jgi:hypothetical protein